MRERYIELPSLESLPHETCSICGVSKIRGLFTPIELECRAQRLPRCRLCVGDISVKQRLTRVGQSAYMNPKSK